MKDWLSRLVQVDHGGPPVVKETHGSVLEAMAAAAGVEHDQTARVPAPWEANLWTLGDVSRGARMGLPSTATVGDDVPKLLSKILSSGLMTRRVFAAAAPASKDVGGEVVTADSIIAAVAALEWIPDHSFVVTLLTRFAEAHAAEDARCVDAELQRRLAVEADLRVPIKFAHRADASAEQKTKLSGEYSAFVNVEASVVRALAPRRTAAFVLAALVGWVATDLAHRAFAFNPASRPETADMSSNLLKVPDFSSCWTPKEVIAAAAAAKLEARPCLKPPSHLSAAFCVKPPSHYSTNALELSGKAKRCQALARGCGESSGSCLGRGAEEGRGGGG